MTLGCKVNQAESDIARGTAGRPGLAAGRTRRAGRSLHRQHLHGDAEGGHAVAPGRAPGHPGAPARLRDRDRLLRGNRPRGAGRDSRGRLHRRPERQGRARPRSSRRSARSATRSPPG
ncbi:MAG: hypothetical protein MZV70_10535 [Desulfobacterales bacterium]|nr:hypothetical protein [Desulfobacterales bacterium]